MKFFADRPIHLLFEERREELRREIQSEDRNQILNVGENAYVEYLTNKYHLPPLTIDRAGIYARSEERLVPAEKFPPSFNVNPGEKYPRQVLTYHVPYDGGLGAIGLAPFVRSNIGGSLDQSNRVILFEIVS